MLPIMGAAIIVSSKARKKHKKHKRAQLIYILLALIFFGLCTISSQMVCPRTTCNTSFESSINFLERRGIFIFFQGHSGVFNPGQRFKNAVIQWSKVQPSHAAHQNIRLTVPYKYKLAKCSLTMSMLTIATKNLAKWDKILKLETPGHVTYQKIRLTVLYNDQLRTFA